jgi:hypothetical protein
MTQNASSFVLRGGLDLTTPAIAKEPGSLIGCMNYETVLSGYRRIDGFERYSGKPKPSLASYWMLNFDAGTVAVTAGQTVTGFSSTATGVALINGILTSGSYGAGTAAGTLVLTNVVGVFLDNETLKVSATTVALANGDADERAALTDELDQTYYHAAIELARTNIAALPGEGPVRGVWFYGASAYAFRDATGGATCKMYKSGTGGWAEQTFGNKLAFDTGTAIFTAGLTVTGAGGANAVIRRVVRRGGVWGSTAYGILVLGTITAGPFINNEAITDTGGGAALVDGVNSAITLPPGGRYDFVNHNFFGAAALRRMYFVNGVGLAHEWDGTYLVPIPTGMTTDTPTHLAVNHQHLFLSFPGGSLQNSGIGDPYAWTPILGAAEIGIGEEITGLLQDYAKVMVVFGKNAVKVLYGTSNADWTLESVAAHAGAAEWTAQTVGLPTYFDEAGLRTLATTANYGDFLLGTLTQLVSPLLAVKRKGGVTPVGSVRVHGKDQYRLFFSDGSGIIVSFGVGKHPATTIVDLGMVVRCCAVSEDADGNNIMLFGSDDGYVYEIDAGTSYDGEPIPAFIRLPFNNLGSPSREKRMHSLSLETDSDGDVDLNFVVEYSYADPDLPSPLEIPATISGGGGFWDEAVWDAFYWSAQVVGLAHADIDGTGTNISLAVIGEAIYEEPHTLQAVTYHHSPRRLVK